MMMNPQLWSKYFDAKHQELVSEITSLSATL